MYYANHLSGKLKTLIVIKKKGRKKSKFEGSQLDFTALSNITHALSLTLHMASL